jgi:Na+/proline symporter
MLADVISDFVQGSVLIVGLLLIGALALTRGDLSVLSELPPERLALAAPNASLLDLGEAWAVPILGSVMAPELVARVLAAKSPKVARRATIAATGLYFTMGLIPVLLGLAGTQLLPELDDPEQVLLHQAARYLPGVVYALFAGALVSAILSTVDSALLVAGSLLAHNLALPLLGAVPPARALRINRIAVTGCGLLAYLIARSADSVYALVEEASAFGSAGVVVCAVFALFSDFGGHRSALAALLSGVLVYAGGAYVLVLDHPYLLSLGCALAAYVGVAWRLERAPSGGHSTR